MMHVVAGERRPGVVRRRPSDRERVRPAGTVLAALASAGPDPCRREMADPNSLKRHP